VAISFNADLIDDLARRRVVLFLGAGVSASAVTNSGGRFKGWGAFLEAAAALLSDVDDKRALKRILRDKDYLLASEMLRRILGPKWTEFVEEEFGQAATPSRLHTALIKLDQRLILTTNFDRLLETAWSRANDGVSTKTHHPIVISEIDANALRLFRDPRDFIVKLHGTIDKPDGMVFDKSSYHRFAYANSFYDELLKSLLLTHTFLFVGFSMDDPAVSMIVERAAHRFPQARPHYILAPSKLHPAEDALWRKLRGLYVLSYRKNNHHRELVKGLTDLVPAVEMRRQELVAEERLAVEQKP